jgi:hypothetical protein
MEATYQMNANIISVAFDYANLDTETRLVVQRRTDEIRDRMRRSAQDIFEIGERLVDVRSRLSAESFSSWLRAEFDLGRSMAYNFIGVYERFSDRPNFGQLDIAASALYLLAAPSTPDEARAEALERAESGERIGHKEAKQIVAEHRPAPPAPSYSEIARQRQQRQAARDARHPDEVAPPPPNPLADLREELEALEARRAAGKFDAADAVSLTDLDDALEDLAERLDDAEYEALARRISDLAEDAPTAPPAAPVAEAAPILCRRCHQPPPPESHLESDECVPCRYVRLAELPGAPDSPWLLRTAHTEALKIADSADRAKKIAAINAAAERLGVNLDAEPLAPAAGGPVGSPARAESAASAPPADDRGIGPNTPAHLIPPDWDAWRARARALRPQHAAIPNELTMSITGRATLAYGGRVDPVVRDAAFFLRGGWGDICARIAALEAAQPAEAPTPTDYHAALNAAGYDVGALSALRAQIAEDAALDDTERGPFVSAISWRITTATAAAAPVEEVEEEAVQVEAAEFAEYDDGDGVTVSIRSVGLAPAVAEAIVQIAESLRLMALGHAHAVDTTLLDSLISQLTDTQTHARGTLQTVLSLVSGDAEALTTERKAA